MAGNIKIESVSAVPNSDSSSNTNSQNIIEIESIWDIFTKIPDVQKAKCNICNKSIGTKNNGTSALHSHGSIHKYQAKKQQKRKRAGNDGSKDSYNF